MENLRGSLLMVLSMAGFALEDMFIKYLAGTLAIGQITIMLGIGGALAFSAVSAWRGEPTLSRLMLHPAVMLRSLGEMIGTLSYLTALALTPLSSVSSILQAMPLAVTLGAALFMGAQVGWRRWTAIVVGFCGVLMIIRPGLSGFEPASLFAVLAVFGLALRDLATRAVPVTATSWQLSTYGFLALIPTGFIMLGVSGEMTVPSRQDWMLFAGAMMASLVAYYAIVGAMRLGEVAVVTPFRYSRLIFALLIGILLFGERPDFWTYAGAAIIIGSGLYTFLRERHMARRARARVRAGA